MDNLIDPPILWERQSGEPNRWYGRFINYYVPLGADRSFEQAFRNWYKDQPSKANQSNSRRKVRPSVTWYDQARTWNWKERAEAWDRDQARKRAVAEDKEKEDWQAKRRQLMTGYFAKLAQGLSSLDKLGEGASLGAITQAVKMILDQNRLEYGLPTEISKIDQTIDVEWQETNE